MAPVRARRALLYVGGSALTREAMRLALVRFGLRVSEAGSVPIATDRLERSSTDAVLLDVDGMDDDDAVAAVPILRQASRCPVGVISADPSPILSAGVIRAGATAFLTKHTSLAEFRYSMERLLQGQLVVDPVVARSLMSLLGPDAEPATSGPLVAPMHLTPVERRVLNLAAGGYLNKQIAIELGLSPLTIKNHLARIRARLGATDKAHAVATALRAGLLD